MLKLLTIKLGLFIMCNQMIKIGKNISLDDLDQTQKDFLRGLESGREVTNGLAIFWRDGDAARFIADFKVTSESNSKFEKEAPRGFYRAGVVMFIHWKDLYLVVPDERYQWWKPAPAGLARFNEGQDLLLTAQRELAEEVFIISLPQIDPNRPKLRSARYLPQEVAGELYNASLDLTAEKVVPVGELKHEGYHYNETNKSFETLFSWDISPIAEEFTISLNESWYAGGNAGISVYAMDKNGSIAGIFSGQQSFQTLNNYKLHETLEKFLEIPG